MGIGAGIFLIALGAILTFGVQVNTGWLDLNVVGWVLMLTGTVGILLTVYFWKRRRQTRLVTPVDVAPTDDVVAPRGVATGDVPPSQRVPTDPRNARA